MTINDDLPRRLADYYETEAPPAAPAWVLGDALATIDSTPQRRVFIRVPWRKFPTMNKMLAVGLGAVAVVVIGTFLGAQLLGTPTNLGGASETAEPTVSQEARTLTFDIEPMATGGEARGTVVVDIAGRGYTMTITVENLEPNGQYPITLFAGHCPNPELPSQANPDGYAVLIVQQTPADDSGTLTYEKEFEGLWEIPEAGRTLTIGGRAPAESNTNIACADLTE